MKTKKYINTYFKKKTYHKVSFYFVFLITIILATFMQIIRNLKKTVQHEKKYKKCIKYTLVYKKTDKTTNYVAFATPKKN